MSTTKVNDSAWHDRKYGADEEHVVRAGIEHGAALDAALELQSISIRLPTQMIRQYKMIAAHHGVGYQPLMRDVLARFVPGALKEVFEAEEKKADAAAKRAVIPGKLKKAA